MAFSDLLNDSVTLFHRNVLSRIGNLERMVKNGKAYDEINKIQKVGYLNRINEFVDTQIQNILFESHFCLIDLI